MGMLRAGMAVAAMFIGGIAAFLAAVIAFSAFKSGSLQISYGTGADAVSETIALASDTARFWKWFIILSVVPGVLGVLGARWGWRTINHR